MKNLFYPIVVCLLLCGISPSQAQKSVGNIAAQPLWGPTGYNTVEYYFIPDISAYYSVEMKKFIYQENGKWIFSENLPAAYKDYDLYTGYKVVINRPQPYLNFRAHSVRYANYLGQKNRQVAIVNSTNSKYFVVSGHPQGMSAEEKASINKE